MTPFLLARLGLAGAAALTALAGALPATPAPLPGLGGASSAGLVIALLVVGFAFLGAELFVIPGFGVAGILGAAAVLAGIALAWSQFGALWGLGLTLASLALLGLALLVLFRSRAGQRLVLDTNLADARAVPDDAERWVGRHGVAVTPLRPAGSADIGGERLEVETDGEFLSSGTPVVVVRAELGRLVVEAASEAPAPASAPRPEGPPSGGSQPEASDDEGDR